MNLNSEKLTEIFELLRAAKCPDPDCDGNGTCAKHRIRDNGQETFDIWQCKWCDDRKRLIGDD